MSSLYRRITDKNVEIIENFDISLNEAVDIKRNAERELDMIATAFKYGYMQGQRAAAQHK